jgi:predicted house-cleaning noncanonical NTP pyrophosphatase (MazG superfamily)
MIPYWQIAMESYNKLVRDKIPEILDAKGIAYEKRIATLEEYRQELIKKLGEEVQEFVEAGSPEELADVLEVIEALRELSDYAAVEEIRLKKLEERGGFKEKIILKGEK